MTQELTGWDNIVVASVQLPPEPASVAVARRFVERVLGEIGRSAGVEVVVLLTSELVTNAVIHAGTAVDVLVLNLHGSVQIEVFDAGKQTPVVVDGVLVSRSGEGLRIVGALSEAWVLTLGEMARPSGFAARRDSRWRAFDSRKSRCAIANDGTSSGWDRYESGWQAVGVSANGGYAQRRPEFFRRFVPSVTLRYLVRYR